MITLDSLLYLSDGKMPSPMADSIQIAKMSQAFGRQLKRFELVTSGDWRSLLKRGIDEHFLTWYGITQPFQLTRLPILGRKPLVFDPAAYAPRGYVKAALIYCRWRHSQVVFTRTPFFVPLLLQQRQKVVLEFHEPLDARMFNPSLWHDPNLLGIVTLADELAQGYQSQGLAAQKICLAPSAAEISDFVPAQDTQHARQTLQLPQDRPLLAYAGQLYDYKGIPLILELATRFPDYHFLLVGGAVEDVAAIRARLQAQGLTNIQLTGHVSQQLLPTYLYAADILLLPTSPQWKLASTTSPLKLFDYMAAQRPIVASDLPNIATILQDHVNGRLVKPDDVGAFESAIAELLANPTLAKNLAQQAYIDVQSRTWDTRAQHILEFIQDRLNSNQ
ncbi:MAG: glycosyltransferase family 4 protein [Spirulina sp. SIO3F2]|nr:glycosyltransferase family 4 protein [Spirulina sp. SIO3F2]